MNFNDNEFLNGDVESELTMNTPNIATPITDVASKELVGYPFKDGDHPLVDLARQLERDRARLLGVLSKGGWTDCTQYDAILASLEIKDDK